MKKILLSLLLISVTAFAQYSDPNFPIPATGYGSTGSHTIDLISFTNPYFPLKQIEIYYPTDVTGPVPTIFYSHAYGGNESANIIGLLEFVAKKGYAIVFVPYQTNNTVSVEQRYTNLIEGFRKAANEHQTIIDTNKVGFLGHSFGGGASYYMANELFNNDGWGTEGLFVYALAQWYSYNLEDEPEVTLPPNTKLLVEIFNDDEFNDHRMAVDLFNNVDVPASEKDFLLVSSSTVNGYNYEAIHNLPNTTDAYNALDIYAYHRLLAALCDYTFNGSLVGKNVALGHGSTAQVTMPAGMGNLQQFSNPPVLYPQDGYEFKCSNEELNPRSEYCPEGAELGLAMNTDNHNAATIQLYPNPADTEIYIHLPGQINLQITLCNSLGQQIGSYTSATDNFTVNVSNLQRGVYFINVNGAQQKFIKI